MRALVVEDDPHTSEYVRASLAEAGWVVEMAFDGEAGLARARSALFDVIIVDRMLPKLDGLSLVSAFRAGDGRTAVLFLTAMGAISDRVAGLEGGGDDYLVKPFSLAELKARVAALARRPALGGAPGGGAGRFRGGNGTVRQYLLLDDANLSLWFERSVTPAWGLSGGEPGLGPAVVVRDVDGAEVRMLKVNARPLKAGTVITVASGGGGFGPARERSAEQVRGDVENRFISASKADAAYGFQPVEP